LGNEEVAFKYLVDGLGKSKPGYSKIKFCGRKLQYPDKKNNKYNAMRLQSGVQLIGAS
jgi:hypothetical protein